MSKHSISNTSRQRLEYYYSIAVMVLIPVLIVVSTFILTSSVKEDYNRELRRKADTVNKVLAASIKDKLTDSAATQKVVDEILVQNDEIVELSIVVPNNSDKNALAKSFTVLASSNLTSVGEPASGLLLTTAIQEDRSIATEQKLANGKRSWAVATQIKENSETMGIIITNFGFDHVDALVASILNQSLFVLMGVVAVVVLLLLNHFKFVNYSVLFKKLKEVDQLKNDFLSVATHELKSPMAVIKGSLENIIDGVFGDPNEKVKESIELALMETDRLVSLVTDLLNVSRIEQGRISYKSEPVVINDTISHLIKQYRAKADEKNITLTYNRPDTDFVITADHGRVLEVFTNLIDNAIKYSDKGQVTITQKVEKNIIKTVVQDSGIGMSAKEREKLFTRFYRIQKNPSTPGTGLGLWIIKQYIEAMHGNIYVDSLENVGSSFTVEFPLTSQTAKTAANTVQ